MIEQEQAQNKQRWLVEKQIRWQAGPNTHKK